MHDDDASSPRSTFAESGAPAAVGGSACAAVLGEGGLLSRALPGYEPRASQLAMAEAVASALAEHQALLCEAGTGTGKTLAYLVPAILSGQRVVISTGTRHLQEQLFQKDLPLLQRLLPQPFTAVRLKGISNYLCLRRLELARKAREAHQSVTSAEDDAARDLLPLRGQQRLPGFPEPAPPPQGRGALQDIIAWHERSATGDRAELPDLADDAPEWLEVAASSETRLGSRCTFFERCFVTRARRAAHAAQIIVVNHHLLCADLAVRARFPEARLLPAYDALICDEAHQLEEVAADYFGVSVSSARLHALLRDLRQLAHQPPLRAVDRDALEAACSAASTAADRLLTTLALRTGVQRTTANPGEPLRAALHSEHLHGEPQQEGLALDSALEAAQHALTAASLGQPSESAQLLHRRAQALRDDLAQILDGAARPGGAQVYWLSASAADAAQPLRVTLHATPTDVAGLLRSRLYSECPSVVLTSATLAPGGRFDFARYRLGLPDDTRELRLPSPFDYRRQALLYLPADLPEPADPAFLPAACARIEELVALTRGRAFLLFTSHGRMQRAYQSLRHRLRGYPLFLQGEAPKHLLTARFAAALKPGGVGGVLFATTSFWEGVDVVGEALQLVVMDKLPFQPPDDPVLEARSRRLEEQGLDPFSTYQVPRAALALAQGFGRLIRHRGDRGIVALLDRRAATRGYGPRVLAGLPSQCPRVHELAQVQAFWSATRDLQADA